MKRVLLIVLAVLLPLMVLHALTVQSVRATDNGKRSSRITINLSETAEPVIQSIGDLTRVSISGAKLGTAAADYRRLSHIIDYISLQESTSGATITIKTMGRYQVSHSSSGSRISIDIVNPDAPAPSPPSRPAVQSASQSSTPASRPGGPELQQAPLISEMDTPEDGATADSSASVSTDPLDIPTTEAFDIREVSFLNRLTDAIAVNLTAYLVILIICLFLLIWLIVLEFKCRKNAIHPKPSVPKQPKSEAKTERLDLGLGGSTLIMDTETKIKMVTKLLEEGWNTRQIAKEMKISPKEIEKIAKKAQISDF